MSDFQSDLPLLIESPAILRLTLKPHPMNRFLFSRLFGIVFFILGMTDAGSGQCQLFNVQESVYLTFKAGIDTSFSIPFTTGLACQNWEGPTYSFPGWNSDHGTIAQSGTQIHFSPSNFDDSSQIESSFQATCVISYSFQDGGDIEVINESVELNFSNSNSDETLSADNIPQETIIEAQGEYEYSLDVQDSDYQEQLDLLSVEFDDTDYDEFFSYNSSNQKITFSPDGNLNGAISQPITITAPDGESVEITFSITIAPIADIAWNDGNQVDFNEGESGSVNLNQFIEADDGSLQWAFATDSFVALFSIDPSSGELTFDGTNSDYCGTENLGIVVWDVNDSTNSASTGTVTVQVNCVNDAPIVGTTPVITPISGADGIFAPCEGSSLILGLEELESWFLDTNDTNYPGDQNVTPGINWGTIQAEGDWSTLVSWSEGEQEIVIDIPDSTTDSGVTEFSIPIQVADYNSSSVTDTLNLPVRSANDLPQVTSTNLEFEVFDGESFEVTIEWADVDGGAAGYSSDVVLNPHNWPAEIEIVNLEDSYGATGSFTLNLTSSELACGQFDLNFDLANSFEGIDPGFDVNACYSEEGMTSTLSVIISLLDDDADGIPDHYSDEIVGLNGEQGGDSDGDGIPDMVENNWEANSDLGCNYSFVDTDGDEIPDWFDLDSDNDSIPDGVEGAGDFDNDNIPNFRDTDSDGDDILDTLEWSSAEGSDNDSDDDGNPDFLEVDSDNDGLDDNEEDFNLNGSWDFPESSARLADSDGDGEDDNDEAQTLGLPWGTAYPRIDLDSDDDGLSDSYERTQDLNPYWPDTDFDFLWDGLELGIPQDSALSQDGVIQGTATDIGDGLDNWDKDEYTCSGSSSNRYFNGIETEHNVTSPTEADSDGDGIIDGYEDANHNGKFDGVEAPDPVIEGATPCANCYADCPDCGGAPYPNAAESDPADDCSPNCLAGVSCDCDGTSDNDTIIPQENFCDELWVELCQIENPSDLNTSDLNDAIWELLMPNSSCDRMVRNGFTTMPSNAQNIFTKTNSTSDGGYSVGDNLVIPADEDGDGYPYSCDKCNLGYHLAYNLQSDGYIPCAGCSYVGGQYTNDDNTDGSDDDGISGFCDACPNDEGGVKGCMDYQAINYNPFAACEGLVPNNIPCIYTWNESLSDSTIYACEGDHINVLQKLGLDTIPWGGNGQKVSVIYGIDEFEIWNNNGSVDFPVSHLLNNDSCGSYEVKLKIEHPIESTWFAFKDSSEAFNTMRATPEEFFFNNHGIEGFGIQASTDQTVTTEYWRELPFTIQVDAMPEIGTTVLEVCSNYEGDVSISAPFSFGCNGGGNANYTWSYLGNSVLPNDLDLTGATLDPIPRDFFENDGATFNVAVEVGACANNEDYVVSIVDASNIQLSSPILAIEPNGEGTVSFCSNRTDSLSFEVTYSGGLLSYPSTFQSHCSDDSCNVPFASLSNDLEATFTLSGNDYCPDRTTKVTFIQNTAPSLEWTTSDSLICASDPVESLEYDAQQNETSIQDVQWFFLFESDSISLGIQDFDFSGFILPYDTLSYENHLAQRELVIQVPAEADSQNFFGCSTISENLNVQIAEAPVIDILSGELSPDTIRVCDNTLDDFFAFTLDVQGGMWDSNFRDEYSNDFPVYDEIDSLGVFVIDSLFANLDQDTSKLFVTSEAAAFENVENSPQCPSFSDSLVFIRRTAPSIDWADGENLKICETAPLLAVEFSGSAGSTENLNVSWSQVEALGVNSNSLDLSSTVEGSIDLNLGDLDFGNGFSISEDLHLTVPAEASDDYDGFGCASESAELVVEVYKAPQIPTDDDWNSDFGSAWCAPYSAIIDTVLTDNQASTASLWDASVDIGIDSLHGCVLDTLTLKAENANSIETGANVVDIAMEWNNNEEGTRKCASLYDTLTVKIGNSPVIDSLNFGLFPEATSTLGLFDNLDYCAGGDPLSFMLWPEALDTPQSSNDSATVGYIWTQVSTTNTLGVDRFLSWSPPSNTDSLIGEANWTYNLDGILWTCSADTTISLNDLLNGGTACSGLDIVELPYYSYAAQANSNGVEGPAGVQWGYFSDDGSSAQYFTEPEPTIVNGVFYPSDEEWEVMEIDINELENSDVVSRLFAVVSFYEEGECPCLSLGNSTIVSDVDEQWIIDQLGFRVYPNPTTGGVYVEGPRGDFGPEVFAEFYDYTGKRVHRERMESPGREYFDLAHLRNGMYILRIVSPSGVLHTSTLVLTQY